MNEQDFYTYLKEQDINYLHFLHPAVYTVEEADRLLTNAPGARTKNLFISDEKKQHYYLLWTIGNKQINFKALGKNQNLGKPRFASPEKLMEYLGIEPGAVSILALVNNHDRNVTLLIDEDLWKYDSFQCHPLVNTATIVLSKENILKFLKNNGTDYKIITLMEKA